jgi:hypothetical protein
MDASKSPANYNTIFQYGSWLVIAVVLTGGAQFDSTAKLSAAFAYLILVATVLYYGPAAIKNINNLSGNSSTVSKLTSTVTTATGGTVQHPVNQTGGGV